MSGHFWLCDEQMERLRPFFPKSQGKPRVDDRRVLSGIINVKKNGLQWKDAPAVYGLPETLYNRFVRWSRMCVFARIFAALAQPGPDGETIMIDSTHLKAHRTAASLSKGGTRTRAIGRTALIWPGERKNVSGRPRPSQTRCSLEFSPPLV